MNKKIIGVFVIMIVVILLIIAYIQSGVDEIDANFYKDEISFGDMKLTSSAFVNKENIPKKYTCEGDNVSPPLAISGIPENTKSLALIMFDPDIPQEFKDRMNIEGWDHWQVWNINPSTVEIGEGAVPTGAVQGKQTGGNLGYTGPCPPKDKEPPEHRYIFTAYALDIESLDIKEGSTRNELLIAVENHILDKTELIGVYEKEA